METMSCLSLPATRIMQSRFENEATGGLFLGGGIPLKSHPIAAECIYDNFLDCTDAAPVKKT